MARRTIQCQHKKPISSCGVCYPKFLQATSVGDYLDNPLGFSNDVIVHSFAHTLLTIALNHNSAVVESAAIIISAGELKPSSHKRMVKEFKRLRDEYVKNYDQALKEMELKIAEETYGR